MKRVAKIAERKSIHSTERYLAVTRRMTGRTPAA